MRRWKEFSKFDCRWDAMLLSIHIMSDEALWSIRHGVFLWGSGIELSVRSLFLPCSCRFLLLRQKYGIMEQVGKKKGANVSPGAALWHSAPRSARSELLTETGRPPRNMGWSTAGHKKTEMIICWCSILIFFFFNWIQRDDNFWPDQSASFLWPHSYFLRPPGGPELCTSCRRPGPSDRKSQEAMLKMSTTVERGFFTLSTNCDKNPYMVIGEVWNEILNLASLPRVVNLIFNMRCKMAASWFSGWGIIPNRA